MPMQGDPASRSSAAPPSLKREVGDSFESSNEGPQFSSIGLRCCQLGSHSGVCLLCMHHQRHRLGPLQIASAGSQTCKRIPCRHCVDFDICARITLEIEALLRKGRTKKFPLTLAHMICPAWSFQDREVSRCHVGGPCKLGGDPGKPLGLNVILIDSGDNNMSAEKALIVTRDANMGRTLFVASLEDELVVSPATEPARTETPLTKTI